MAAAAAPLSNLALRRRISDLEELLRNASACLADAHARVPDPLNRCIRLAQHVESTLAKSEVNKPLSDAEVGVLQVVVELADGKSDAEWVKYGFRRKTFDSLKSKIVH